MTTANPPERRDEVWPILAGASAWSFALVAIAAFGPRLWATQSGDNAPIAVQIVAAGQLIFAALAWPAWTRRLSSAVCVTASAPLWLLLAAKLSNESLVAIAAVAGCTSAIYALMAGVRWLTPPRLLPMAWCAIALLILAPSALRVLVSDFETRAPTPSWVGNGPMDFIFATFLHSR